MIPSLPASFLARLKDIVSERHIDHVVKNLSGDRRVGARVNTLRADVENVFSSLSDRGIQIEPLPWYRPGFTIPAEQRSLLMASTEYVKYQVYLQNTSSMLAAWLVLPQSGEEILDLTAAPGSKTLMMACLISNAGRIAAVERNKTRFFKLKANVQSQGAECVRCYWADGRTLWRKVPERFDRVILDAPCSSEGRFRSHDPGSYAHWSVRKIEEMARLQKQLAFSAIHCLKPGGVLLYSTCTFAPEENEAAVDWMLRTFPGVIEVESLERLPFTAMPGISQWQDSLFDRRVAQSVRVLPDGYSEAFFICRLKKLRAVGGKDKSKEIGERRN